MSSFLLPPVGDHHDVHFPFLDLSPRDTAMHPPTDFDHRGFFGVGDGGSGCRRRAGGPGPGRRAGEAHSGRRHRLRQRVALVPAAPVEVPVRRAGQRLRHHPGAGEGAGREVQDPQPVPAHRQDARRGGVRPAGQPDRHAGARAAQPAGDRGRQARLEREADGQLARRPGRSCSPRRRRRACGSGARRRWWSARSSRSWPRRSPPGSSAGSPRPTPTTGTPGRTGPRSSTRRAAAACPTWPSTT